MRFLFYSHDGLGLGHTRRNLALATALTQLSANARVLLATGVEEIQELGLPENVDTLKLPQLRKTPAGYTARRLNIPASDLRALRSTLLKAAVESFRPAVLIVDKHPLGASGELREALTALRAQGGRTVLGLRDVLDDSQTVLQEWAEHNLAAEIAKWYDLVLIYGHPWLFNAAEEYQLPPAVVSKTHFCGYVVCPEVGGGSSEIPSFSGKLAKGKRPVVLATAGGGEDGFFLLETFLRACRHVPWEGMVVTGPMTPRHELKTLQAMADEVSVKLHRFLPGLPHLFWSIDALVCMGGYNTLAEALAKGLPTVCVPRTTPRREQLIRAQAFEKAGLMQMIHPAELSVDKLQETIASSLQRSRTQIVEKVNSCLHLNGAEQAASHILALASAKDQPKPAAPDVSDRLPLKKEALLP